MNSRKNGLLAEEELILASAEMPLLSPGFRARALALALETERRRARGRRAVLTAWLVFACLGCAAWRGPLSLLGDELANFGVARASAAEASYDPRPPLLPVSRRYGRGELILSASNDDWNFVEAEILSRAEGSRRLLMSF
jgi:hypothetical protein